MTINPKKRRQLEKLNKEVGFFSLTGEGELCSQLIRKFAPKGGDLSLPKKAILWHK